MKKDRNAFFESSSFNAINPGMNPNMMNPNMMNPNMVNPNMMNPNMMPGVPGQISSNANFYAGPPLNTNQNMGPGMSQSNIPADIDSRLAKIERQINRLETRISKLEGDTGISTFPENDTNYSNSMYMV